VHKDNCPLLPVSGIFSVKGAAVLRANSACVLGVGITRKSTRVPKFQSAVRTLPVRDNAMKPPIIDVEIST